MCRETGDRYGEGQALNNLGNAYQELRRFEKAVGCHERALVICRETGDRCGEGQALNNLGNAYQELRLSDRAAVSWRDAAAAMRDAWDYEQAARLEQMAASARARARLRRWRRSADLLAEDRVAPLPDVYDCSPKAGAHAAEGWPRSAA